MNYITPKKSLGQHFLRDRNIAQKIVSSIQPENTGTVLEIGPGMGILTGFLLENPAYTTYAVEIDSESINYLYDNYPDIKNRIISGNFLDLKLSELFPTPLVIIGNFPYNIGSQIFFKVLENKEIVQQVVCMVQKEVAERIAAHPSSKTYGILSVLLQAFYNIEYLFTVNENVFFPPPKVKSAVIRLKRNNTTGLACNEKLFFNVVKTSFNQRRKTIHNSLKSIVKEHPENYLFRQRPEQLSVDEFVVLTNIVSQCLVPGSIKY